MTTAVNLFGIDVAVASEDAAMQETTRWAAARESRMVCFLNVHGLVTAGRSADLRTALRASDLVLADGAPIAWLIRTAGWPNQRRIAGPDCMDRLCAAAADRGLSVFLLGGSDAALEALSRRLRERHPGLDIVGTFSPPFRSWTPEDEGAIATRVAAADPAITFVGLGCPKQEIWMHAAKGRLQTVLVGVGAAFDFLSLRKPRAPAWMRNAGLEWLHRLASEPRRLAGRYLVTNLQFIALIAGSLLRHGHPRGSAR